MMLSSDVDSIKSRQMQWQDSSILQSKINQMILEFIFIKKKFLKMISYSPSLEAFFLSSHSVSCLALVPSLYLVIYLELNFLFLNV